MRSAGNGERLRISSTSGSGVRATSGPGVSADWLPCVLSKVRLGKEKSLAFERSSCGYMSRRAGQEPEVTLEVREVSLVTIS